jgi:hypothetical protein
VRPRLGHRLAVRLVFLPVTRVPFSRGPAAGLTTDVLESGADLWTRYDLRRDEPPSAASFSVLGSQYRHRQEPPTSAAGSRNGKPKHAALCSTLDNREIAVEERSIAVSRARCLEARVDLLSSIPSPVSNLDHFGDFDGRTSGCLSPKLSRFPTASQRSPLVSNISKLADILSSADTRQPRPYHRCCRVARCNHAGPVLLAD